MTGQKQPKIPDNSVYFLGSSPEFVGRFASCEVRFLRNGRAKNDALTRGELRVLPLNYWGIRTSAPSALGC